MRQLGTLHQHRVFRKRCHWESRYVGEGREWERWGRSYFRAMLFPVLISFCASLVFSLVRRLREPQLSRFPPLSHRPQAVP